MQLLKLLLSFAAHRAYGIVNLRTSSLAQKTNLLQETALVEAIKPLLLETVSEAIKPLLEAQEHRLLQERAPESIASNPLLVRPNAGKGPDEVKYGLRAMNFYGTDLMHHTWSVDMVMILRWNDPRIVDLIPQGLESLSMSWNQAAARIWMPGVTVTNRDIREYEIISASVTLFKSGEVRRVERANTRVMKKFELMNYPFDYQNLTIDIASSKYMSAEVAMVPDKESSEVEEHIWGLYNLTSWNVESYPARDGELEKSRGEMSIVVKRRLEKYSQDHLVPAFICLMISWAVFYFPFANPFITARLALSVLALLTFTNLMVKSGKELPGAAPFNWNDLFNQQIQALMFITIVLNISSEVCFHHFKEVGLAKNINNEAKIVMPLMSLLNIIIILGSGMYKWMGLYTAADVTKWTLVIFVLGYAFYFAHGVMKPGRKGDTDTKGSIKSDSNNQQSGGEADCDGGADGGGNPIM